MKKVFPFLTFRFKCLEFSQYDLRINSSFEITDFPLKLKLTPRVWGWNVENLHYSATKNVIQLPTHGRSKETDCTSEM